MPTNEQWNNYGAQVNQLTAPSITAAAATSDSRKGREYADKVNRENREEARRIMEQQREWALSDWHMVNAYNSPDQQMQRYMDAGLNPNLIYGSATNSPSAMVRNTTQGAARAESSGYIEALGIRSRGISGAMQQATNNYFANQALKNDTNLKNAQILNLKAQTDKTDWSNKLTETTFNDLLAKIRLDNIGQMWENSIKKQQDKIVPTPQQFDKRYDAETQRTIELLELAKKEGKLKQSDIETMERLSASPAGIKLIIDLLKIITK
jgi:hypothetical protein